MATNIPTHNLGEVIDACIAYVDNPDITIEGLIEHLPGPDFPTGALIIGRNGIREAYHSGRGSIVMRGRTHIEEMRKDREAIVITEIPYQVNKARMIERIAEVRAREDHRGHRRPARRVRPRRRARRDRAEARRHVRRGAEPALPHTPLQTSFGVNMLALNGGRPQMMTIKDIIVAFIAFREDVIIRRTVYRAGQGARAGAYLRRSGRRRRQPRRDDRADPRAPDPSTAREQLMAREWPANDMSPLIELIDEPGRGVAGGHLPAVGRAGARHPGTAAAAPDRAGARQDRRRAAGGDRRRSPITWKSWPRGDAAGDPAHRTARGEGAVRHAAPHRRSMDLEFEPDIEDLIQREDMVVTVSHSGYIKRVPLSTLPRPAPRRQGPLRHGTRDGGFRHRAVRRQHAHADAVLLARGHGLQAEGLPPAPGHAAGARQGAGQPAAAGRGRDRSPPSCRCPRTRRAGATCASCSRPTRAMSGATSCPTSPTSAPTARSP